MNTIKNTIKTFAKGLFNPKNKLSLIPNWLSFSRVIGGITIPIMAYSKVPLPWLFGNVTFLAISDFLDGFTARTLAKEETSEGAMLDAVSDKIFSLSLIIGILPILPIFALNGILEGAISLVNGKLLASGGKPKSNFLGKVKIWPLSIALILGYLALAIQNLNIAGITNETLLMISTALSIGTLPLQAVNVKQYIDEYKNQTNIKPEENKENEEAEEKIQTIQNENKHVKQNSFKLNKAHHQAMVYELPTQASAIENSIKETPKQKVLSKKTNKKTIS